MAIPDYQTLMRPLLGLLADGAEHPLRSLKTGLAERFKLTQEELEQMLASGVATVFTDRVGWARYYLQRAGMLHQPSRSVYQITPAGQQLLKDAPDRITTALLRERSPELHQWIEASNRPNAAKSQATTTHAVEQPDTPEEALSEAYQSLRTAVESDLLARLRVCSPGFFEQVVVRLLVAMGYGGSLQDAGKAIGRSGDEGIDGIINEDRLGLDVVYVQAKRWAATIGRPDIQQFAGALAGKRARKGVFITTSSFTAEARAYVGSIEPKIVLISGEQLAQFMFEHNVGVALTSTYEVKKVDADFFDED
ncbi:MAG: restriction endonuclease [Vicinamibacterales bacterium]